MLPPPIQEQLNEQLQVHGYRLTSNREVIFNAIYKHQEALSLQDLELLLEPLDKSTISRTLNIFLRCGVIHKIDDGSGIHKYAISEKEHQSGNSHALHAHFFCEKCQRTYCIDELVLPLSITLPHGYSYNSLSLVLKGTCPQCNTK